MSGAPEHDRAPGPFIKRVRLTNYKSIASCDVELGPLTVLVGPNGSGKSNFLDALSFVSEAVTTSPAQAVDRRGGLAEILRRVPEPMDSFSILLTGTVPWGPNLDQQADAAYGFTVRRDTRPGQRSFKVESESCTLTWKKAVQRFLVHDGEVTVDSDFPDRPLRIEPDRLYLLNASARPSYAPLFAALRGMYFFTPEPEALRRLQPQSPGATLGPRGEHLGDVLGDLDPQYKERLDSYMAAVVPELDSVGRRFEGNYVTVELRTRTGSGGTDVTFGPGAMSEGTLRATGVLAALFQPSVLDGRISLVAVEEPEIALHPAAAGALFDALTETSHRAQVLVTSQSADLLDRDKLDTSIIRVTTMRSGVTTIGPLSHADLAVVRQGLTTPGELMRAGVLEPELPAGQESESAGE